MSSASSPTARASWLNRSRKQRVHLEQGGVFFQQEQERREECGLAVVALPARRRRLRRRGTLGCPAPSDNDTAGLLLPGETLERCLLVGIGLEHGHELGYLHEIIHPLLQVQ